MPLLRRHTTRQQLRKHLLRRVKAVTLNDPEQLPLWIINVSTKTRPGIAQLLAKGLCTPLRRAFENLLGRKEKRRCWSG